ncbi:helix-turn-helix domain-containing protein [Flavobacterium columnare]|uniref:helix-turn-helix domain-containing protein n=1 Tax=Flavobacterium columnare TaxID=996 RepID=UPI0018E0C092|nr:helix-turn-helix transcriptional regulator [Flavobacterium columnare]
MFFTLCCAHRKPFCANVYRISERSGSLSQKEVAISIGIDQAQYSRIESGKVEPTVSSLEKIAEALNVKVYQFFEEDTIDINSFEKTIIEKVQLIEELDEEERKSIYNIIDIAVSRKRLKNNLTKALDNL